MSPGRVISKAATGPWAANALAIYDKNRGLGFEFSILIVFRYAGEVHPILFQMGSFALHSYGVMMAAAFLMGLWTAMSRARLAGLPPERIADATLWLIVGAVLGARVVYVTTYWNQEFADQPFTEVFMIQHGGLVYYGGLIGATLAGVLALWRLKLPLWKTADVFAPSIALGSVFGRVGCLLNGCCYGRVCQMPWAITFTNPQAHQYSGTPLGIPLHPTEVYDALLNLLLYGLLAWMFRHKKFDGQIFSTYLILYSIFRSVVEYFRGDYPDDHIHAGLTSAQLVSIPIFISGLTLAAILSRRTSAKV